MNDNRNDLPSLDAGRFLQDVEIIKTMPTSHLDIMPSVVESSVPTSHLNPPATPPPPPPPPSDKK